MQRRKLPWVDNKRWQLWSGWVARGRRCFLKKLKLGNMSSLLHKANMQKKWKQSYELPRYDISAEPECQVSRPLDLQSRRSESDAWSRVAASSKESWDPSEQGVWKLYFQDDPPYFLSWQRFRVGGDGSYLYSVGLTRIRFTLRGVSVNKLHKKKTKGIKFYLWVVQTE